MPKSGESEFQYKDIALTGKFISSLPSVAIGENFSVLTNLRYTSVGLQGVSGMTKINTTALSSYPLVRSAFHYVKDNPSESHLLVQAFNSGKTASVVLENTTAIPSQGDFSGTPVFFDSSGAVVGYFSNAPTNRVAYCNGEDTCLWAGDESTLAAIINYDGSNNQFDFTNALNNSKEDVANVAVLNGGVSGGLDGDTVLLLHFNNNLTDSSLTTPHTPVGNNISYSSGTKKFGSHALYINSGVSSPSVTISDDADFSFGDKNFTIDFWCYPASTNTCYYFTKWVDGNNLIQIYSGSSLLYATLYSGGTYILLYSGAASMPINTWYHVALTVLNNNVYLFLNGQLVDNDVFTPTLNIGSADLVIGDATSSLTNSFYMDEFRISMTARYTSDFTVPSGEYSSGSGAAYAYLGSLQPIRGYKVYVKTPNTTSSTLTTEYWDGSAWTAVVGATDNTASGGITLADSGTVTFNDTKESAKTKIINGLALFWYRLTWSSVTTGTSLYQVTLDSSMQPIQDIWDGDIRTCLSFYKYTTVYNDLTISVYDEDYSSANTATYASVGALTASSQYLLCGFAERMTALDFTLVAGNVNTTASTSATVYYWSGSAWVSVGTIVDGTSAGSISFARSGVISWDAPAKELEFKQSFSGGLYLYYYKIVFNQNLSANVYIDFLGGIPAQEDLGKYSFSFMAQNRLVLCDDTTKDRNSALVSAKGTSVVFNGSDSTKFYFGDATKLTAGIGLYVQLGSSYENIKVFFKNAETWLVLGSDPSNWVQYQASDTIGCVAPATLKTVHVDFETVPGLNRYVLVFQSSTGIYLFDGKTFYLISEDIKNLWDINASTRINPSMLNASTGFFDLTRLEYHFQCAVGSSTTLNKEYVYSFKFNKWYEIDRGTGLRLQLGCTVADTGGYSYNYGFIDTGYCERLEYGTSFDSSEIAYTFRLGNLLLTKSVFQQTTLREVRVGTVAKTETDTISVTNYGDDSTTGTSITLSQNKSGYNFTMPSKSCGFGKYALQSLSFSVSTTTETSGFEPITVGVLYKQSGLDRT